LIKFTVILLYLFSIFLVSIVFKKYNEDSREIVRKIIHIGIGPLIPIAQFLKIDQNSALIFTGIVSLMVLINYTYKLFPTIEDVDRKSYGTLFYCLSLFILICLFWDKDPYALITGFFIMTFGDGLAGLIGKSFNSKSWIFFKQKKSLLGTLTMFLTSLIVVCSIGYSQQNSFYLNYFVIASLATVLEQFSVLGVDNFIVPISSALYFNFFITN
jgi:phytol kinase